MLRSFSTPGLLPQLKPFAAAFVLVHTASVFASPVFLSSPGEHVTVDQSKPGTTLVTQTAPRAMANWREFSIPVDARVQFIQPGADSVIVNTVVGESPSEIFGKLDANGRVFLVNPNGIVFGANSQVNVGSLVGSTLQLKKGTDVEADEYEFQADKGAGHIRTEGEINARELAMIAPQIVNTGVLNTVGNRALVQLIAAGKVTANLNGSDLVFSIEAGHEKAVVEQLGSVFAEGGKIALIARPTSNGKHSVINTAGLNKADRIVVEGDTVRLGGDFNTDKPSGSVSVHARQIDQAVAVRIGSDASLGAESIQLSHQDNSFTGLVTLGSTWPHAPGFSKSGTRNEVKAASLHAAGNLRLAGAADNLKGSAGNTLEVLAFDAQQVTLDAVDIQLGKLSSLKSLNLKGNSVGQSGGLQVSGTTVLTVNKARLVAHGNDFSGQLTVQAHVDAMPELEIHSTNSLDIRADRLLLGAHTQGDLKVNANHLDMKSTQVKGNSYLSADQLKLGQSAFEGDLLVSSRQLSQSAAISVQGEAHFHAVNGVVNLPDQGNDFQKAVSMVGRQTFLASQGHLTLAKLGSAGGEIRAGGTLFLDGNIDQQGGMLVFTSNGLPQPLSPAAIKAMLPVALDVFSGKEAVEPVTGLGRITLADASIQQLSGGIRSAADSRIHFNSTGNGSVLLTGQNRIQGGLSLLAGSSYGKAYQYEPGLGASLVAVNNQGRLSVGGQGIEADLVALQARGITTDRAESSVIRARMPYNNFAAGAARSFPGLTLAVPVQTSAFRPFEFGQPGDSGPLHVEVGDTARPGLGGLLSVLPVAGSAVAPGQVVYLQGASQSFFYEGARDLNRIPVVYNGALLLSPQEGAALTSAQGAVILARQEQTRSVVRTENVAGKVISGVVQELGPGSPATGGTGAAQRPPVCEVMELNLACRP